MSEENSSQYTKIHLTPAFQTRVPITCENEWGHTKSIPGDYLLVGATGDIYTQSKESFNDTYSRVKGESFLYRQTARVFARRMRTSFICVNANGILTSFAG